MIPPLDPSQSIPQSPKQLEQLRQASEELEASFLAEMLKSAGYGKPRTSLGGGAGEEQFASLLMTEQARVLAAGGGIGLAEVLFDALKARLET